MLCRNGLTSSVRASGGVGLLLALCAGCASGPLQVPLTVGPAAASSSSSMPVPIKVASPRGLYVPPVRTPATLASFTAASRLLDQATFGPTAADVQHVQTVGLDAYITEQLQVAPTVLAAVPTGYKITAQRAALESEFLTAAMSGQDQLRQRVAFALSELFVVSSEGMSAYSIVPYHNMLARDAFGNFETLLQDVTLSSTMGAYLNLLDSAAPQAGQLANENYAREFMQLFTVGPNLLNADATTVLDGSGNPLPVYTQSQVQAFARAYTGWTYANADGSSPASFPNAVENIDSPMAAVESAHDTGAKTLLNGVVLPPGQTARQDLLAAIDNVFKHPNVGPFVCRQLIQHLVTSDPSPPYVARVAAVFADNGQGVRGDMSAVLRAIFADHKARAGDTGPTLIDGHLREPILYITAVYRGLGWSGDPGGGLRYYAQLLQERPYESPSVFNFYPQDYTIEGGTKVAPEFGAENTATLQLRQTAADDIVNNLPPAVVGGNVNPLIMTDLSTTSPLGMLAATPDALIDALSQTFLHGQMPSDMRSFLVSFVATIPDLAQRTRTAVYLVITSSQYTDEH